MLGRKEGREKERVILPIRIQSSASKLARYGLHSPLENIEGVYRGSLASSQVVGNIPLLSFLSSFHLLTGWRDKSDLELASRFEEWLYHIVKYQSTVLRLRCTVFSKYLVDSV